MKIEAPLDMTRPMSSYSATEQQAILNAAGNPRIDNVGSKRVEQILKFEARCMMSMGKEGERDG